MLFSIPRDFIFFSFSFTKWVDNLFSLVLEILKNNNKYKNRKKYSDPPTSCPILLVIRTFTWKGLVLNFFHISSSSADLCSECFVTISAFDYRLHHHLIYFFFPWGNIFLSLSNILKLGNLTCVLVSGKEHSYGKSSPVGFGIHSTLI